MSKNRLTKHPAKLMESVEPLDCRGRVWAAGSGSLAI